MKFPKHWATTRTQIASVSFAEAESLTALFNSSSDIAALDPTFRTVDIREVLRHIEESERAETVERGFRMQAIRLSGSRELVGYFHFREGTPKPDVVALTMFFIRPEFRSQGYGREVAQSLIEKLSEDLMNRAAWGRVYLKNIPALRFWFSLGFTHVVKHKREHVQIEGDHANIILERPLQRTTR